MKRKTSDLIAGILCLGFSIVGITIMEKSELITWITILFFGIGAISLLFNYIKPDNNFSRQNNHKELSEEELMELYNSKGVFNYNQNGFEVQIENELTEIKWNEIQKITGFKVDLFASDEIRLFLEADNGKQFEISESTQGWYQFNEKLKEQFSSINKSWEVDITVPAFERKETEIYNRNKNVA